MRISASVAVAIVISAVAGVGAKGPTIKLTVSGGNLRSPIEVTSKPALVHVWSDDFIAAPSAQPPAELLRYQVAFHVLPKGTREPQVLYVITYARDPVSGEGFIYLPGPGEAYHSLNVSTMLREEKDGRWHRATPAWAQALNHSLPR